MDRKKVQYFNDAQQFILAMNPRTAVAVCGRGTGKGCIQAGRMKTAFQLMKGSCGGFVAPSVKRCLTNILPSILIHFERWGLKRDLHFVVGHKPPKALHWDAPIFTPDNWENTISFYNGSVCNIISQNSDGTSNSMSLDYVIVDEAKYIDATQFKEETLLANRGNEQFFGECYLHHGLTITSDMPQTLKGSWFLDYEKESDNEIVQTLWFVCRMIAQMEKKMDENPALAVNLGPKMDKYVRLRDKLRRDCTLYVEFSSLENIDILTEDYIRRMKRDLSEKNFLRSVGNKRSKIAEDGFYNGLDEEVNLYTAPDTSMLSLEMVGTPDLVDDCRLDSDLNPQEPISIGMDINARFNCMTCGQATDSKLRILKSFFVKFKDKRPELIQKFADYYKYHPTKVVIFYYDATFVGATSGRHEDEPYVIISDLLKSHGWTVIEKYIGAPMRHVDKNQLINSMFKGQAEHLLLINRDNNEDLIISVENAGVVYDKKDKSHEKAPEEDNDLLEHRTDFSDSLDTLCIGTEKFPATFLSVCPPNVY